MEKVLEAGARERHLLELQLAAFKEQEAGYRHAALHDILTGLPNRALFNDRLERGLAQAKRRDRPLAVLFIDLDDFKTINDSHGHDAGDAVLQTIAGRLKENTRESDTISRHGGDEFLYLITEIREEQDIVVIAEKVIKAIQAPCNIRVRDVNFDLCVRASIGIAVFPINGVSADTLVKSADEAMYRAKQNGPGGHSFAR